MGTYADLWGRIGPYGVIGGLWGDLLGHMGNYVGQWGPKEAEDDILGPKRTYGGQWGPK